MKHLKRLLWLALLLPLIFVGVLLVLFALVDPNALKPALRNAAASQGLELALEGDMGWQFWPSLGVSLGGVTLRQSRTTEQEPPLLQADSAAASIQLLPLLQRRIEVDGVYVKDAAIYLRVDETGDNNWTLSANDSPTLDESGGDLPNLSIASVRLDNAALDYRDLKSGQSVHLEQIDAAASQVALDSSTFPFSVNLVARGDSLPAALSLAAHGNLGLDLAQRLTTLSEASVEVEVREQPEVRARAEVSARASWGDAPSSNGKIRIEPFDLADWLALLGGEPLPTASAQALTDVAADLRYEYHDETLKLSVTDLRIDRTQFSGDASIGMGDTLRLEAAIRGNSMNLDDYLAPAAATDEATEPAPATPLPFELLRSLGLDVSLALDSLVVQGITLIEPQVRITADQGIVQLRGMQAGILDGAVGASGRLDASRSPATLTAELAGQDIQVGELLQQLTQFDAVRGAAQVEAQVTSRGATDQALVDNLRAVATLRSQQMRWQAINLEQQFCKAVALLQGAEAPAHDWPEFTELEPVELRLTYAGDTLQVSQLDATIANLQADARGELNLESGKFDFPFNLSLGAFAGGMEGCLPIKDAWRERALPIRCKGSLDEFGVRTCLPNTQLLTQMAKGRVEEKVQEKKAEVDRKIEQKKDEAEQQLEQRAKELLRDKLGEDQGKAAEQRIRGLLDRRKSE